MGKVKFNPTKAHQRYKLIDGSRVCGSTTVLGVINKPALLRWAWQCGMNGQDYRKTADKAANIGTIAHWLIECHLKGLEPDTAEFSPVDMGQAEAAFLKFLEWWETENWELISSELQLVHAQERYGGTLDLIAKCNGETALIDIKTSKGIYDNHWMQVASYGKLWTEGTIEMVDGNPLRRTPPLKPLAHHFIARFGKQDAASDFEVQRKDDVALYWQAFAAAKDLYNGLRAIRGN